MKISVVFVLSSEFVVKLKHFVDNQARRNAKRTFNRDKMCFERIITIVGNMTPFTLRSL